MAKQTILILGGTAEAAALARALAGDDRLELISSLAGRAGIPQLPGRVRVGGFGGAAGLEAYLRAEGIGAVVDATHPFAARISAHAEAACAALGLPRLVLERPHWQEQAGDRWTWAADTDEAVRLLPTMGWRAFLTVGAGEVAAFAGVAGVWFLVRLLNAAALPLADYAVVTGRPPFSPESERELMVAHKIDVLVTKASGGTATMAKIEAARSLGLAVLMIRRPPPPSGEVAQGIADAVAWVRGRTG